MIITIEPKNEIDQNGKLTLQIPNSWSDDIHAITHTIPINGILACNSESAVIIYLKIECTRISYLSGCGID